jgi:hypothetical protein
VATLREVASRGYTAGDRGSMWSALLGADVSKGGNRPGAIWSFCRLHNYRSKNKHSQRGIFVLEKKQRMLSDRSGDRYGALTIIPLEL